MRKSIVNFSKYSVTETGEVFGPRGHVISPHCNKGKLAVKIHNDLGKRVAVPVHRAVAEAFIGVPEGFRVKHIDGDIYNNSVDNLEVYDHRSSDDRKAELARARSLRWATANKEKVLAVGKKWREDNRGRSQSLVRKRQARKLKATPTWANESKIDDFYKESVRLTKLTGIQHHVDHIIPLQGKDVCGLHVENNLQVIPYYLNLQKGNKFKET